MRESGYLNTLTCQTPVCHVWTVNQDIYTCTPICSWQTMMNSEQITVNAEKALQQSDKIKVVRRT